MGTSTALTIASTRSPTMDEIPPTCHHQGGTNQQHILFVKPSVTLWSDACEYVIGGYINNGLAWQRRIPSEWHGKLMLNLLEFLASAVTIYMTILRMEQGSHILALTDSSSALFWMHKASFDLLSV